MSKPRIGISSYREPSAWGIWQTVEADLVPAAYTQCIQEAGGIAFVIPIHSDTDDHAGQIVDQIDGLLIAGGADIGPQRYGQSPHPATAGVRAERDEWELALLRAAYTRDMPVLGICRGMQLMAVAAGGQLIQDLADQCGDDSHTLAAGDYRDVSVTASAGSRIEAMLGHTITARCHHHQAVRIHPGFVASAWCRDVVEAMESPTQPFQIGVQWHPEVSAHSALFAGFVAASRASRLVEPG